MDAYVIVQLTSDGANVIGVRPTLDGAKMCADLSDLSDPVTTKPVDWYGWREIPTRALEHAARAWERQTVGGGLNCITQHIELHFTGPRG